MPQLQRLALAGSQQSLQRAASFINLQSLCLFEQRATSWDLSCCTGLTEPRLTIPTYFQHLSLPHGQDVQLQALSACEDESSERRNEDFVLQHLASASKLTSLEFYVTYPGTLRDGPGLYKCHICKKLSLSVCSAPCQNSGCLIHS